MFTHAPCLVYDFVTLGSYWVNSITSLSCHIREVRKQMHKQGELREICTFLVFYCVPMYMCMCILAWEVHTYIGIAVIYIGRYLYHTGVYTYIWYIRVSSTYIINYPLKFSLITRSNQKCVYISDKHDMWKQMSV